MTGNMLERRHQTSQMVRELLDERRQVWTLFCEIGAMQPFGGQQKLALETKLQEFCQLLIDYISLGHFGIYQRIIDGSERRCKVLEVAERIYPCIAEATDAAVEFNDKYERLPGRSLVAQLGEDLSRLGEALARRNELEDQLITAMVS
jgi:regulator of sigma D